MTHLITLHDADIKQFPIDNGLGVLSGVISAQVEEELNGLFDVTFEYDIEGALAEEIEQERIVKLMAQDKLGYQLFRIHTVEKSHEGDRLIVHARHITYDLANNFVEELNAHRITKKQVMELIGEKAVEPHPFNITSSNTSTVSSTRLYRTNPLQMIGGMDGSVLQIWGGQIERDNFNLVMHDRRGHDDGVTVTYEKNITGLNAEFDYSGLVTRIFPFVLVEATEDEPERLITVNGKYIDSPLINVYNKIYMAPVDYSGDDRIDTQDKTDAQIRTQLQEVAGRYFYDTGNDKPRINIDVKFAHLWDTEEYREFAPLEQVGMGDTVTVRHSRLGIDVTATVNYIKYDAVAGVNIEVGLGYVKADFSDSVSKIDTIERKVEQAESNANQAIVIANGKNTTYYGPDEPVEGMQKGDLWFKVIDGQYHKTYRYDGIEWQLIIDMDSQEAKAEAQHARERADDAVNRANQATEDANKAIGQAQSSFDLALENALELETLGLRFDDVEGNLTTISGTVDGLQTTVSDVQGNVSNLTQLSNTLQARLSDAEGNINTLTQTVDSTVSRIGSLANPNLITHDPNEWESVGNVFISPKDILFGERYAIEPNKTYTITNYSVNGELWITLYGDSDRVITLSKGESITFTTESDEKHYIIAVHDADPDFLEKLGIEYRFKLEEGTESTAWTAHDEDIYTQYSQLSDAINLRVAKGDVINQINLDTSGILISGKKLVLDGDTTVTGTFKVGNANITSIDAGKITVGDLVGHSLVGGSVIGGYIEQQSGGNRVEIHNGTVSHYRYGELKSAMDGSGHRFYQNGAHVGYIGTSSWIGDDNYRGLLFSLDNKADYMTWAFRKNQSDENPTTMLAWHKTSNKDNKGFTFNDNVHILHDSNLYVRRILTIGYTDGRKAVELQNFTWNNNDGVILTRAPNRGDRTAGLFMTSKRAALIDGGNASIEVGNDSSGNYVKSIDIWNRTSSNSSNVRVGSSGMLLRTSSASKYKLLIENEEEKGYNYNNILNLNIKSWYDKLEADTLCDLITNGLTDYEDEYKPYLRRHFGLVAEDLEEAGLKEFVDYNDETGEIEGIKYDRLWTLLIPITRQHRDDIERLKLENQYLKQKVKILEDRVS